MIAWLALGLSAVSLVISAIGHRSTGLRISFRSGPPSGDGWLELTIRNHGAAVRVENLGLRWIYPKRLRRGTNFHRKQMTWLVDSYGQTDEQNFEEFGLPVTLDARIGYVFLHLDERPVLDALDLDRLRVRPVALVQGRRRWSARRFLIRRQES